MKRRQKYRLLGIMLFLIVGLNFLSWNSREFSDAYVKYIFPIWTNTYGRVTSVVSFSVGEVMIALGLIWAVLACILGFVAVIFFLFFRRTNGNRIMTRILCEYFSWGAVTAIVVMAVVTLNYTILYHCSTFEDKYLTNEEKEYSTKELADLRDLIATRANELSKIVKRDECGRIIYPEDMERIAIESMRKLGTDYEQLQGFYPMPKKLAASEFVSQQYIQGYYFPFSLEANYNAVMNPMRHPAAICHELAHVKGFIYEDEANLIGFLACINSDDPVFQYSGYLSVLNYLDNDFYESFHKDKSIYCAHVAISSRVKKDNTFLEPETWHKIEKKTVIKTAVVKKASKKFIDTNLVVNGIEEGDICYGEVVGLLLNFYDESGGEKADTEYVAQIE